MLNHKVYPRVSALLIGLLVSLVPSAARGSLPQTTLGGQDVRPTDPQFAGTGGRSPLQDVKTPLALALPQPRAQIIPDATLGPESSRLVGDTLNGVAIDRLEGGATRGSSLFHSFQEFNIGENRGAYFSNPAGISNIFSRITGSNPSNILGVLGVQGSANLFLLNPNGIIFGPNSRLDLGGSFLATTADSFAFAGGVEFASSNPQALPLLSVGIPLGLNFRGQAGAIVNQSQTSQTLFGTRTAIGLAVSPGQTLALVGGDVSLPGGTISTTGGNVLLGSVAGPGRVNLSAAVSGWSLDYGGVAEFGAIDLSGTATVRASGPGGGAIDLHGGTITLRDQASLVSDTLGSLNGRDITLTANQLNIFDLASLSTGTLGSGNGGNLSVRAAEAVLIQGSGFGVLRQNFLDPVSNGVVNLSVTRQSGLSAGTIGPGNSGNLTIDTQQFILRNGALVYSPTVGSGAGGTLTVRAAEAIEVTESALLTPAFSRGTGGNLTLDTQRLSIRNGSIVSTATVGTGNGGNLLVRAQESVTVSQNRLDSPFGTGLSTNALGNESNAGNAGLLEINTGTLRVELGATITSTSGFASATRLIPATGQGGDILINATEAVIVTNPPAEDFAQRSLIVAGTVTTGQGGNITINTRRLLTEGNSGIGANTLGSGQSGNVVVNASESVVLRGNGSRGRNPSGLATASGDLSLQTNLQLPPPTGTAGNIRVVTPHLMVSDGATLNVGSLGTGPAGNIDLVADQIDLDTAGQIDGRTIAGTGANINLLARQIRLRRGSQISTDAGTSDGGNINIKSEFLLTLPGENSDITANARTARGGQIAIAVPNIFGFVALGREQIQGQLGLSNAEFAALTVNPTTLLPSSDIAAISQVAGAALQGTVSFSSSGVNPAQGLVELATTVSDPTLLVTENACTQTQGSSFIRTGRGGVPSQPTDALAVSPLAPVWVEPAGRSPARMGGLPQPSLPETPAIAWRGDRAPAEGWIVDGQGQVTLVDRGVSLAGQDRSGSQGARHHLSAPATCIPR